MITQRTQFKSNDFLFDSVEWATPHGSVTHVTKPNKENGGFDITVKIKSDNLPSDQVLSIWAISDKVVKSQIVKPLNQMIKQGLL